MRDSSGYKSPPELGPTFSPILGRIQQSSHNRLSKEKKSWHFAVCTQDRKPCGNEHFPGGRIAGQENLKTWTQSPIWKYKDVYVAISSTWLKWQEMEIKPLSWGIIGKYVFPYGWFSFHFNAVFFSLAEAFYFDEVPFIFTFLYVPSSRGHISENIAAWNIWDFPAYVLLKDFYGVTTYI